MTLPDGHPRDLAALYRSLARLVSAGIPPLQCASLLQGEQHGRGARAAAGAFVEAFSKAGLPSAALRRAGAPATHVAVIESGESTGRMDASLDLLASWCEKQAQIRALATRLLLEPAVAWLVIALLVPLDRLVRSGLPAYLAAALPVLLLPPLALIALRRLGRATGSLPGLGEATRLLAAARFCRTLGLLNAAGLPLPRALRDAARAAADGAVTPAAERAAAAVERGATLGDALRREGVLRPVEMALVADGEATGRLDVAFARAAELLEHEGFARIRSRVRVAGAILFVAIAAYTALRMASAVTGASGELSG